MTQQARELLAATAQALAPQQGTNRLVAAIAAGTASRIVLGTLALEQRHIVAADRRSFQHLAVRATDRPEGAELFATMAEGEALALDRLGATLRGCGLDEVTTEAYEPMPGCQAFPAYVSWLALNGDPADVAVALYANFSAWGTYCATIAAALRARYGFADEACGFFDFFALPAPALKDQAVAAVQEGLDAGHVTMARALRYGRLLQAYEAMFWETLAAQDASAPH
ncbi:transcriptional regulator [Streptomyces ficellus]|uniref:Transcriptional regulator n=1 Tax=Streptomyces ficellus TaxID=1977088 RepID=A0A6I6F9S6_9ACTN|nr:transcriptional regulator [Streptomyces ficellus]QGV76962.1 transcriptional regulator [Streptomyces ficellus]